MTIPILYIPHGGGPLPLLGDSAHAGLTSFLTEIPKKIGTPKAILVISAHWEEAIATVSSAAHPEMYYDYSGFPDAAYKITYPAPGDPQLAQQIVDRLNAAGITAQADPARGYDHGTFVPLKLMYPQATIPVVQLSLVASLEPQAQINLGKAIGALAHQDILILGSGLSFHNMRVLMQRNTETSPQSVIFDQWLNTTLADSSADWGEMEKALVNWEAAPEARFCHPREEHLLPLHVCFGAARAAGLSATNVYDEPLMGSKVSGFMWA